MTSVRTTIDIDFSRLLGFDALASRSESGVDFRDPAFGARAGAKVGGEPGESAAAAGPATQGCWPPPRA